MSLKARYCSQCSALLETRLIDGRRRDTCPQCQTVFYQNPLPVASAVVLNERREVLLVKRAKEPQKGEWCLPIGFAELGETIAEAALRELREEAGIDGRILRLLDVDSYGSDHYGDLLIVSFEVARSGGAERAGDDADEVAYFPLDRLPPLAFAANDRALRACAEAHRDEWAMRDSFLRLAGSAHRTMLSDELAALLTAHAGEITRRWIDELRANPTTGAYKREAERLLAPHGGQMVELFELWLRAGGGPAEIRVLFSALGREQHAAGVPIRQVFSALTLLRREIWEFVREKGIWERPIDIYRVLEFDRRLALFFDRATHQMARGYETGGTPPSAGEKR